MDYELLTAPLSLADMRARKAETGYVSGVISVNLEELIHRDHEGLLDFLSMRLTGGDLLNGMEYEIVGCDLENQMIHLKVTGDPICYFEMDDSESEEETEREDVVDMFGALMFDALML